MTQVLDHGEVRLVDHMAGDHKVYGAARISTGKDPAESSKGEAADRKLIAYLMKAGHGTPFEHAVFQFFIKAPIFVTREWQRHRMASYNEFSMRYAEVNDDTAEFYIPSKIRVVDPNNKQSSVAVDPEPGVYDDALHYMLQSSMDSYNRYRAFINDGVAREMARMVLPVNLYTKFWFTVNARSLLNFLELRNSPAAQYEIREFAVVLEAEFARIMPWTYEAFIANGRKAP